MQNTERTHVSECGNAAIKARVEVACKLYRAAAVKRRLWRINLLQSILSERLPRRTKVLLVMTQQY